MTAAIVPEATSATRPPRTRPTRKQTLVGWSFALPFFALKLFEPGNEVFGAIVGFLLYFCLYSITFFFNSALVGAALIRLEGGDPTLADGFGAARSRIGPILGYAAIAATVGIALSALKNKENNFLVRMFARLKGIDLISDLDGAIDPEPGESCATLTPDSVRGKAIVEKTNLRGTLSLAGDSVRFAGPTTRAIRACARRSSSRLRTAPASSSTRRPICASRRCATV